MPQSTHPLTPALAAKYVRMSTEHQQYSIDNQTAAIEQYARDHGMEIVRTYLDSGKSGLTIENRPGLRQLIADVESGFPAFSVVLVYDVSRWGRFQDIDESAFYEYRCRRAKIALHYCAEQFSNDGSTLAALVKTLKRTMAAEYSRELSAKVFAGQCRLTELGFRQGGTAGYGFRRLLVDANGDPKSVLKLGEKKSIATDRVVLIPGPEEELEIVRQVFRLFALERWRPEKIAEWLNGRGIPGVEGKPWSRFKVSKMVNNPKYIGANVTNRTSGKLRSRRVNNPPEMWVRKDDAFEPLIDSDLYEKAQELNKLRSVHRTDEQMLDRLRWCLREHGTISSKLMKASLGLPCAHAYADRFGSIPEAYKRIGYKSRVNLDFVERERKVRPIRREFMARAIEVLKSNGASVKTFPGSAFLTINNTLNLRFGLTQCRSSVRTNLWKLQVRTPYKPDVTIFARLAAGNETILDYLCVPTRKEQEGQITVSSTTHYPRDIQRFEHLDFLRDFAEWGRGRKARVTSLR